MHEYDIYKLTQCNPIARYHQRKHAEAKGKLLHFCTCCGKHLGHRHRWHFGEKGPIHWDCANPYAASPQIVEEERLRAKNSTLGYGIFLKGDQAPRVFGPTRRKVIEAYEGVTRTTLSKEEIRKHVRRCRVYHEN